MDNITEASLLFDFYGTLLSDRKKEVMELYHEENYSLAEIAQTLNVSRAAVYDSLKSAERALYDYEKKLGFLSAYLERSNAIKRISRELDIVEREVKGAEQEEAIKNIRLEIAGIDDL